jgi:hypothetical protein
MNIHSLYMLAALITFLHWEISSNNASNGNAPIVIIFIDFKKAFDCVHRVSHPLWNYYTCVYLRCTGLRHMISLQLITEHCKRTMCGFIDFYLIVEQFKRAILWIYIHYTCWQEQVTFLHWEISSNNASNGMRPLW